MSKIVRGGGTKNRIQGRTQHVSIYKERKFLLLSVTV